MVPMYPLTTVCIHRLTQVLYCGIHTRTHSIKGRLICLRHGYLFATYVKLVVDMVAQLDKMHHQDDKHNRGTQYENHNLRRQRQ